MKEELEKVTYLWKCTPENIQIIKSRGSERTRRYATLKPTNVNLKNIEGSEHKRTIIIRGKRYRYQIIKAINEGEIKTGTTLRHQISQHDNNEYKEYERKYGKCRSPPTARTPSKNKIHPFPQEESSHLAVITEIQNGTKMSRFVNQLLTLLNNFVANQNVTGKFDFIQYS